MAFRFSERARHAVPYAVAVIVLCALGTTLIPAFAAPSASADKSTIAASLSSSSTAVPLTGSFEYTAHVRLNNPASYLQTRLQIRRPNGKLVFQRTFVENSAQTGTLDYTFGRALDGLELDSGTYPIQLSVSADVGGSTEETEVAGELLVYDAKSPAIPVVLVARIHGAPLSDPGGRLAVDPVSPEAEVPRADAERVAQLVLEDPGARVVLGVPPVLLSEWKRLSAGYTLADGTVVPGASPVTARYADTLTRLRAAIDTGRLELVSLGYSDPDLSTLVQESLAADVDPQYEAGISACFASMETTPSTGTVPAGDCTPQKTVKSLSEHGVGYVVVSESCVAWGKVKSGSGSFPVSDSQVTALVTDDKSSKAISSGDPDVALRRTFSRLMDTSKPQQPYAVRVDLGPGRPDATSTVVAATSALGSEPWVRLTLGRELESPGKVGAVRLTEAPEGSHVPTGFWKKVRAARTYAEALGSALGPGGAGVASAQTDSLLAESSAWSEPDGTWAYPERGVSFADAALAIAKREFGDVSIKAEPVTFAGKRGEVPVSITNTTKNTLSVVVRAAASGDAQVSGNSLIRTELRPQETFVPIPVDMRSSLSSKLKVEVVAGDVVLARTTVDVQASYLDRIAIIGGIVVVLSVLLIFIVRRVRSAEAVDEDDDPATGGAHDRGTRYTDDEPEAGRGIDDS